LVIIELLAALQILEVAFDYELTVSKLISFSYRFAFLIKQTKGIVIN